MATTIAPGPVPDRPTMYGQVRPNSSAPSPRPSTPTRSHSGHRVADQREPEHREQAQQDDRVERAGKAPAVEVADARGADDTDSPREQEPDGGHGRTGDGQPADEFRKARRVEEVTRGRSR